MSTQIVFTWLPPLGEVADYHRQLAEHADVRWPLSPTFDRLVSTTKDDGSARYRLPQPGLLALGCTYHWRVRARNLAGVWGPWSQVWLPRSASAGILGNDMAKLLRTDAGVIHRNPLPGHRAEGVYYPQAVRLPDGDLLCVVRTAAALYTPDGVMQILRSVDAGRSWQLQGPVLPVDHVPAGYNYAEGLLTILRDGTIVLRAMRADQRDPKRLFFNPDTGGLLPLETCYLRSGDGGRSWSEPVVADLGDAFSPRYSPAPFGSVVELADGGWLQLYDSWNAYTVTEPFDLHSYGLFSTDSGHTWGDRTPVAVGGGGRSYSHGNPTRLSDGRLFISMWAAEPQLQSYFGLVGVTSTDATARSWSEPRGLGIPGQTSHAVELSPGTLVVVYSHRDDPRTPGIKCVLSTDAGQTWNLGAPLVVWDAYGKEALGVPANDRYPSSHDTIAYGAPHICRLDDQRGLVTFWCTQGGDTHARWCEVRVVT